MEPFSFASSEAVEYPVMVRMYVFSQTQRYPLLSRTVY